MTKIKLTKTTFDLIARDKKIMFTTTREHYPFVAAKGSGDYAWDVEGNKFLDFSSFISVYNFGVNGSAAVRKAAKDQIDKLMHAAFLDYHAELPVRFAENLLTMFPKGFGRVFLSNSGTEANEDAIKLARLFTKRSYLVGFTNAFHGRSLGSLGLTATKLVHREHYGPFPNTIHSLYPNFYRDQFHASDPDEHALACIDHLEKVIMAKEYSPKEIAAIFVEPIQGEGGYIVPPRIFMKELRRIADENNIILVSDEVQAGYMRTGKFLAMDNFGVTADIYTMAKAIGGGLPMGATIAKRSFGDTPSGSHAGTFGGNLVAVAAASATLDYIKKNKTGIESMVKRKNRIMMKRLNELRDNYEIVGDVRGLGMMLAIELVKDKRTKEHAIEERTKIVEDSFYNGLLLLPAGTSAIRIIPPITISEKALEEGFDILEGSVKKVNAEKVER